MTADEQIYPRSLQKASEAFRTIWFFVCLYSCSEVAVLISRVSHSTSAEGIGPIGFTENGRRSFGYLNAILFRANLNAHTSDYISHKTGKVNGTESRRSSDGHWISRHHAKSIKWTT